MKLYRSWMVLACFVGIAGAQDIAITVSSLDGEYKLSGLESTAFTEGTVTANETVIRVDPSKTYQTIVGIGSSLEHATCYNLSRVSEADRREVLTRLLDRDEGIGMDLMRICIGTSDFTGDPWYTYNDIPKGETDPEIENFSIEKDRAYLLPTLKIAREINPDLRFVASPWSPPAWMKTSEKITAGRMKEESYAPFARYLIKFLEAYAAEGIPVYAMTVQNEPDYPNPEYPTCHWKPEQQRDFIRDHFGPMLTDIDDPPLLWCWDHNYNYLDFPRTILSDSGAAQYVDGTGFHFYEGEADAMTTLHEEYPDKHIYFTEGSTFGVRGARTIIDIFRNWARCYLAWVTVLDSDRKPNNGPHHASATCIELDTETLEFTYRFDYYMYGQFSKFIDRGAVRIASTDEPGFFRNVAFKNPDGTHVLIVANDRRVEQAFTVMAGEKSANVTAPGKCVATLTWK